MPDLRIHFNASTNDSETRPDGVRVIHNAHVTGYTFDGVLHKLDQIRDITINPDRSISLSATLKRRPHRATKTT